MGANQSVGPGATGLQQNARTGGASGMVTGVTFSKPASSQAAGAGASGTQQSPGKGSASEVVTGVTPSRTISSQAAPLYTSVVSGSQVIPTKFSREPKWGKLMMSLEERNAEKRFLHSVVNGSLIRRKDGSPLLSWFIYLFKAEQRFHMGLQRVMNRSGLILGLLPVMGRASENNPAAIAGFLAFVDLPLGKKLDEKSWKDLDSMFRMLKGYRHATFPKFNNRRGEAIELSKYYRWWRLQEEKKDVVQWDEGPLLTKKDMAEDTYGYYEQAKLEFPVDLFSPADLLIKTGGETKPLKDIQEEESAKKTTARPSNDRVSKTGPVGAEEVKTKLPAVPEPTGENIMTAEGARNFAIKSEKVRADAIAKWRQYMWDNLRRVEKVKDQDIGHNTSLMLRGVNGKISETVLAQTEVVFKRFKTVTAPESDWSSNEDSSERAPYFLGAIPCFLLSIRPWELLAMEWDKEDIADDDFNVRKNAQGKIIHRKGSGPPVTLRNAAEIRQLAEDIRHSHWIKAGLTTKEMQSLISNYQAIQEFSAHNDKEAVDRWIKHKFKGDFDLDTLFGDYFRVAKHPVNVRRGERLSRKAKQAAEEAEKFNGDAELPTPAEKSDEKHGASKDDSGSKQSDSDEKTRAALNTGTKTISDKVKEDLEREALTKQFLMDQKAKIAEQKANLDKDAAAFAEAAIKKRKADEHALKIKATATSPTTKESEPEPAVTQEKTEAVVEAKQVVKDVPAVQSAVDAAQEGHKPVTAKPAKKTKEKKLVDKIEKLAVQKQKEDDELGKKEKKDEQKGTGQKEDGTV